VLLLALLALQTGDGRPTRSSDCVIPCCRPEAFGQHPNAEISYLIEDSKALLGDMLSLAPRTGGGSTGSSSKGAAAGSGTWQEELVEALAHDLLDQVCCTTQLTPRHGQQQPRGRQRHATELATSAGRLLAMCVLTASIMHIYVQLRQESVALCFSLLLLG
jgi:hypothetical protein